MSKNKERSYGHLAHLITNSLVVFTTYFCLLILYSLRMHRHPKFKAKQTCLVVANHRSFMDPPLIGVAMNGHVTYMARHSLWKVPGLSMLLDMVGAVPVDRSKPALDTFRLMLGHLNSGRSVLMFPEGTRTRDGFMGPLLEGFTMIARRAKVPILPVYVHNTDGAWPLGSPLPLATFANVQVLVGHPIEAPKQLSNVEQDKWLYNYIEKWFALAEKNYLGERPTDG